MSDLTDWAAEVGRLHDETVRLMTRNRELESALRVAEASAAFGDCYRAERNLERHRNAGMQRRMDAVRAYLVEVNAEMRDAPRPTAYLDGWMDGVLKLSGDVMALLDGGSE